MGQLFQGVGEGDQGGYIIKGTDAFFLIKHREVPKNKVKAVTYARMVCAIREMKKEQHRTRRRRGHANFSLRKVQIDV